MDKKTKRAAKKIKSVKKLRSMSNKKVPFWMITNTDRAMQKKIFKKISKQDKDLNENVR